MKLLSCADAAAVLGVSVRQVQAWAKSGRLAASRVGVAWVIEEREVSRFAALARGPGWRKGRKRK